MQAGKLNQIIEIHARTEIRDAFGGVDYGWQQIAKPYSHVRFMNGREYQRQDVQLSEISVSFRIRQRKGIDSTMRVVFDDDIYQIVAVLPDAAGKVHMDLACRKWVEHENEG